MRTRAYRPEPPVCLEDRSPLSGAAGLSPDPVVLPRRRFNLVAEQIRQAFLLFARDIETNHLLDEIQDVAVIIPFGQVDGLGVAFKRIVDGMKHDLAGHVPHAVLSARNETLAVIRADVEARVQAGDVVVR